MESLFVLNSSLDIARAIESHMISFSADQILYLSLIQFMKATSILPLDSIRFPLSLKAI